GDGAGARALHRPPDRAPARHVLERPLVPREVACGMGLPAGGPVERLLEDLAGAAGHGVEPAGAARAGPAGERGGAAGGERGLRTGPSRVRLRRALARGHREPRHDDGAGVRAREALRHRRGPRGPALGDRLLDEVTSEGSQGIPIEEGALVMRTSWTPTG